MSASKSYWGASELPTEDLAEILSDYSKDVNGVRTRMHGATRDEIIKELNALDTYMEILASTPEGREQLRHDGWVLKEHS